MNEVERTQWGAIEPGPKAPRPPGLRGTLFRVIGWLIFGLFVPYKIFEWLFNSGGLFATFVDLLGVTPVKNSPEATAAQLDLLNTIRDLLPILATILLNTALLFALRLPNRSLFIRLAKTISLIVAAGIVVSIVVLVVAFWIMPNGSPAEIAILPVLVGALFLILAISAPFIPIWPVNVPDNRVWMILNSGGHLLRYVGAGSHYITPREYGEVYEEKGDFDIVIDDESYVSSDAFPYRLRMKVQCTFNPLDADPAMWVPLRDETRVKLRTDLRTELEYIVRHEMARYWRQGMSLTQVLQTIVMDIREAINSRQHMGIRMAPINAINIILDPPELILEARQRRLSVEALAIADRRDRALEFKDLLQLVAPNAAPNVDVNPQGQITFALNPGDNIYPAEGGPPARFTENEEEQPPDKPDDLPDDLPETMMPPGLPAGPGVTRPINIADIQTEEPVGSRVQEGQEPPESKDKKKTNTPPANPIDQSADEVIETDQDEEGVYIPRSPLANPKPRPKDDDDG